MSSTAAARLVERAARLKSRAKSISIAEMSGYSKFATSVQKEKGASGRLLCLGHDYKPASRQDPNDLERPCNVLRLGKRRSSAGQG